MNWLWNFLKYFLLSSKFMVLRQSKAYILFIDSTILMFFLKKWRIIEHIFTLMKCSRASLGFIELLAYTLWYGWYNLRRVNYLRFIDKVFGFNIFQFIRVAFESLFIGIFLEISFYKCRDIKLRLFRMFPVFGYRGQVFVLFRMIYRIIHAS